MSNDFNFNTNYNDAEDAENEEIDNNLLDDGGNEPETEDFDNEASFENEETDSNRPNFIRLILLVLLVLLLLCGVCYLAFNFLPIPGLTSLLSDEAPADSALVAVQDTPIPAPADNVAADANQTETGAAETESQPAAEAPDSQESTDAVAEGESEEATTQGESEEAAGEGEAAEGVAEGDGGEATTEGEAEEGIAEGEGGEATTEGESQGATAEGESQAPATEGESQAATAEGESQAPATEGESQAPATEGEAQAGTSAEAAACDNNIPPVAEANGPYEATIGKGQAVVIFDVNGSYDPNGSIASYQWDFGDGSPPESGEGIQHGYTGIGIYEAALTVTDNCGDISVDIAEVTILGAEAPAEGENAPEESEGAPPADNTEGTVPDDETDYIPPAVEPWQGTLGFCYLVQPGDTLWGIATTFGVTVYDLAYVNGVSTHYYVIAGQGLFVPVREVSPQGPNIYQVDPGDTMYSISAQCGVPVTMLAHMNGLYVDSPLVPGQVIAIPPPWSY